MTPSQSLILGWIPKFDTSDWKKYRIKFKSLYSENLNKRYIERGEYRSNYPFDLKFKDDATYVFSKSSLDLLTISNNPAIEINELDSFPIEFEPSGIFAITTLFDKLKSIGYERPIQARSFLGRSKGYASMRNQSVFQKDVNQAGISIPLSVFISESFELVGREKNADVILYDPRHEITDLRLGFASKGLIPEEILEKKELQRTITTVLDRYESIHNYLEKSSTEAIEFTKIEPMALSLIPRPNLLLPDGSELPLSSEPLRSFSSFMTENVHGLYDEFSIGIAIENTNLTNEKRKLVDNFVETINRWLKHEITVIEFDVNNLDDIQYKFETLIVVLDDFIPGHSYIHRLIKKEMKCPTKMINLSTLEVVDESLLAILWLSLRFRLKNTLFQTLPDPKPVIGLSHSMVMRGEYYLLSGILMINDEIRSRRELFHRTSTFEIDYDDIIQNFLKSLFEGETIENCIAIYSDNITIGPSIARISKDVGFTSLHIRSSNSIMLQQSNNELKLPIDGQCTPLSETQFLLMTNGIPNEPHIGIPNPILLEIMNFGGLELKDILNSLYAQTYLHPCSLQKTKLPFPLFLSEKNAYIPIEDSILTNWISKEVLL
jgi:hypothetical protein